MTTTTTSPVNCTPWCEYQDGHTPATSPHDQVCVSHEIHIPASLHPTVTMVHEGGGRTIEPEHVTVYAEHRHVEGIASVFVGRGDDAGISLTPEEARHVAAALIATAAVIE